MTPDYARVKQEALRILSKYGVEKPPVPIYQIVEDQGVDVKFVHFNTMGDKIAGFTRFDEATIYVNADDVMNRQTWTIAHEFGHWILHKHLFDKDPDRYSVLMRRPQGLNKDPVEKEANAFARQVLIPERLLRQVKGKASPIMLAKMFLVSPEAMGQALEYV